MIKGSARPESPWPAPMVKMDVGQWRPNPNARAPLPRPKAKPLPREVYAEASDALIIKRKPGPRQDAALALLLEHMNRFWRGE